MVWCSHRSTTHLPNQSSLTRLSTRPGRIPRRTDWWEGSSQVLAHPRLSRARWEVDRRVGRSQRALAPPGSEIIQQDVRAEGVSCVSRSGGCLSGAGLLQECGAPPCPLLPRMVATERHRLASPTAMRAVLPLLVLLPLCAPHKWFPQGQQPSCHMVIPRSQGPGWRGTVLQRAAWTVGRGQPTARLGEQLLGETGRGTGVWRRSGMVSLPFANPRKKCQCFCVAQKTGLGGG